MLKNFNQKEIDFHRQKILNDASYFDSTLSADFCIALQSIHIDSMYSIGENLSAIFEDAYKRDNSKWDILHLMTKNY